MRQTMIERAAQAIYEKHVFGLNQGIPIEGKPAWVPYGNSLKQNEARDYARAAIEAMREPGEDIELAGAAVVVIAAQAPAQTQARLIWQAMLNAILSTEKAPAP